MPDDDRSVFIIPRSLVYGFLTVAIGSIGTGAWWGATVHSDLTTLQRDVVSANQRITDQAISTDGRFGKVYTDTNARFDADEHKLDLTSTFLSQLDLRLTRIETQLTFLVSTTQGGRR